MSLINRVAMIRHGRFAEVKSYVLDDVQTLKIELITSSGSMKIDAADLDVLLRVIELFKHAEHC
jgi:hypothetical protein